jgi:hypothetical protein
MLLLEEVRKASVRRREGADIALDTRKVTATAAARS